MHWWPQSLKAGLLLNFLTASVLVRGILSREEHYEYDEELAKLCVIYSSAAYSKMTEWSFVNPECNKRTEGFVFKESFVGEGTEAFGYVGLDPRNRRIVVAFKGTSDLHDWMTNLRSWVRYQAGCSPAAGPSAAAAAAAAAVDSAPAGREHAAAEAAAAGTVWGKRVPSSAWAEQRRREQRHRGGLAGEEGDFAASELAARGSWEEAAATATATAAAAGGGVEKFGPSRKRGGGGGGGDGDRADVHYLGAREEEALVPAREDSGLRSKSSIGSRGEGRDEEQGEDRAAAEGLSAEGSDFVASGEAEDAPADSSGAWGDSLGGQFDVDYNYGYGQDMSWLETALPDERNEDGHPSRDHEIEIETNDDDDFQLTGNVHYGFCDYYQTLVAEGLADTVARLAKKNPRYKILVTGHSLGAAAAAVCAADLVERIGIKRERVLLYTLGEPRTGDGVFAEAVNDRVGTAYRVVHDHDVVPHLALCCHGWLGRCKGGEVTCPYQHSTEIVYANDMSEGQPWVVCDDEVGEDYACDPQSWDLSVSDHTHYFGLLVGEYCSTAPEDLTPFPVSQERERSRWASYDAGLRQEQEEHGNPFDLSARAWRSS